MANENDAAEKYFYAIKRPGGLTRSEAKSDITQRFGETSGGKIVGRLDEMLAAGNVLHRIGVRKKGGIFGFGIFDGTVLSRTKVKPSKPPYRKQVPEEQVVFFDVDGKLYEIEALVRNFNRLLPGAKIIDYKSYMAGKPYGVLEIPERDEYDLDTGRPTGTKAPPVTLGVPEKKQKYVSEKLLKKGRWKIQIYLKKKIGPHYAEMPDIEFTLRASEEHVKVDNFFTNLRYGNITYVSASLHGITVTMVGRKT